MKSTVIIHRRGSNYVSDVYGRFSCGHTGVDAGTTPEEAAITAARMMLQYSQTNPEGGSLVAPSEVVALVPAHLRDIAPKKPE